MFISPLQIIESLALRRGDIVADFGSGAGAYVFAASKLVGDKGKVYAIDNHKEILEKINTEAEKKNIINIDTILTDIQEKVPVESLSCDLIILSNTLGELHSPEKVILEIKRILKPDGILLVIDWKDIDHILSKNRLGIFSEEKAISLLAKYNFNVKKHFPAGDFHYAFTVMSF